MYFVYLLASRRNGTLYCGVTNDLVRRTWEHKNDEGGAFTTKYKVRTLVWFEAHDSIEAAIQRETRIKGWLRVWKLELIERMNPNWRDLYPDLLPHPLPATSQVQSLVPVIAVGAAQPRRAGTQAGRTQAPAAPGFRVSASLRPE